jgi:hypothetical protein
MAGSRSWLQMLEHDKRKSKITEKHRFVSEAKTPLHKIKYLSSITPTETNRKEYNVEDV